ncbi:MAG: hypothetical protein KGL93_09350 [Gemmatimonadota bacterium]|nr:hypothetical protein [Gemmatimonadota bacterium]HEU4990735.1 hypothetical protein [Gemmatimonadaceae bacterium]
MIQNETRERFLLDMVEHLAGAEIFEVHFFAPRRVSGVERGVAVVAARLPDDAPPDNAGEPAPDEPAAEPAPAPEDSPDALVAAESAAATDDSPYAPEPDAADPAPAMPERYTVLTATYKHTLKGPERGKWEVSVRAEADAPLVTVDQVVRGVQRRAEDTDEVERLTGDEIRAVVHARQPAAG